MKERMSVIITNYNTHKFVDFLLQSLLELSSELPIVYIHDNGSTPSNFNNLKRVINKNKKLKIILVSTIDTAQASFAHGNALDRSIRLVDTEYFCIFDSDCVPLCRGWDDILISKLESGLAVIGSPFWSGKTATHTKYNDFPAQFFVLFRTSDYHKANTTCKAYDRLERDTCMQWRKDFNAQGFKSLVFKAVSTRETNVASISPVICTCYYIDGTLIGSHFGRGHEGGRPKYNGVHSKVKGQHIFYRLPLIRELLILIKANYEFIRWKSKLTDIIKGL